MNFAKAVYHGASVFSERYIQVDHNRGLSYHFGPLYVPIDVVGDTTIKVVET